MKYNITFISDTHNKHYQIDSFLPGGDILIHAGDISSIGTAEEVKVFCKWFEEQSKKYDHCIFIAGNHDWLFEESPNKSQEIVNSYKNIDYLEDDLLMIGGMDYDKMIKIYGSPWQPEFFNWAFNLPRNSEVMEATWEMIPNNTDILITHGPPCLPLSSLDKIAWEHVGCEDLANRIKIVKPKIHVFGHIHGGSGYWFDGDTHFINASVLNEKYNFTNPPINCEWDSETNEIEFL